jgi:hypothetical protein
LNKKHSTSLLPTFSSLPPDHCLPAFTWLVSTA